MFSKIKIARRGDSAPFTIRTIAVIIIIYLLAAAGATWCVSNSYWEQMQKDVRARSEEIAWQLRVCAFTETDSKAYEDGINTALAAAILRYEKYHAFDTYRKYDGQVSLDLFRITRDKNGTPTSVKAVTPPTTVIIGSPLYLGSKIIVFADSMNSKQMKEINEWFSDSNNDGWMTDIHGYQRGRFLYPTRISLDEASAKSALFTADYIGSGGRQITANIQDYQVFLPDGSSHGSYGLESKMDENYQNKISRLTASDLLSTGNTSASSPNSNLSETDVTSSQRISLIDGKYCLSFAVKANIWKYAYTELKSFYFLLLLVMLFLGTLLIFSHNDLITEKFESERRRRLMADSMAHELKNPLGVIRNCGEFLIEDQQDDKCRKYAQAVIDESDYMNDVVVSMLDLSKMEAGTYPLELSEFDPADVISEIAERSRPLMSAKGLTLEFNRESPRKIYADKRLIGIATANFLSNAIRHAEPMSEISLSLTFEHDRFTISVHNLGSPIPEEGLRHIWDAYYYDGNKKGTGLGLAIVRNICLLHGGRYGCGNEDNGVKFWAEFRSQEKHELAAAISSGPVLNVTGSSGSLRGMISAAISIVIAGIFTTTQIGYAFFSRLPFVQWNDFHIQTFFATICLGGVIFALGLMLTGLGSLKQNHTKAILADKLAWGMIVISAADMLANLVSLNSGHLSMVFLSNFTLLTYLALGIGLPVIMLLLYRICADAASAAGSRHNAVRLKRLGISSAALIAAIYVFFMFGWTQYLAILFILWFALYIIAAISWSTAYRKYN